MSEPSNTMMYCVNCDYPITRKELDNRKCNHCGTDPAKDLSRRVHLVTVKPSTLYARLRRGWTMRQAEGKDPPPAQTRGPRKINPNTLRQRARAAGVPISTIYYRIASGMSVEDALASRRRPSRALYWAACDLLEVVEDLLATLEGQVDSMDYDREWALSVIKRAKGEK